MKTKTSVTLSEELLGAIDRAASGHLNRSAFLEAAAWDRLAELGRRRRDARDRRLLDRAARGLNREASDVLGYQAD